MKRLIVSVLIAAIMWFIMFSPFTGGIFNFWISMAVAAAVLWIVSIVNSNGLFLKQFHFSVKDILIGIASAAALWVVFFVGDYISALIFDFEKQQVGNIYNLKSGENPVFIGILLFLLIGPAEEIFWRGYVQRTLAAAKGEWQAMSITTIIYALVHIWSLNFMLIMAALVCGVFWGLLYRYNKNLVALVVSHSLWDVAVFLIFPIG